MQNSCNPVFPGREFRIASNAKPITPFGGLVSLIVFLAEAPLVLRAWLRCGNTSSARKTAAFLTEAFTLQLQGSSAPREFFASRERIREKKSAVGRRVIDVDGYTFRVFVTNRQGDGAELWRDCNLLSLYQHASAQEQRCKAGFKRPPTSSSAGWSGKTQAARRNILQWAEATSPRLPPEPPGDWLSDGTSAAKPRAF